MIASSISIAISCHFLLRSSGRTSSLSSFSFHNCCIKSLAFTCMGVISTNGSKFIDDKLNISRFVTTFFLLAFLHLDILILFFFYCYFFFLGFVFFFFFFFFFLLLEFQYQKLNPDPASNFLDSV